MKDPQRSKGGIFFSLTQSLRESRKARRKANKAIGRYKAGRRSLTRFL